MLEIQIPRGVWRTDSGCPLVPERGSGRGTAPLREIDAKHLTVHLRVSPLLLSILLVAGSAPSPGARLDDLGPLITPRSGHNAVLLQDGRVMVLAGREPGGPPLPTVDVEMYDPRTETWTLDDDPLPEARYDSTATLLQDGRVLVAGGVDATGTVLATSWIFDPGLSGAGGWSAGSSLGDRRAGHTATLLANGKVLVAGGQGCTAATAPCDVLTAPSLPTAEVYEPATGSWSFTVNNLTQRRHHHTATFLPSNGTVLSRPQEACSR